MTELDPNRIRPMTGVMVVQIVEVLGGTTKAGLFVPGSMMDHSGKDTCLVKVLRKGASPEKRYSNKTDGTTTVRDCSSWPDDYRQICVGDVVCMPRDVPMVIVWEGLRYALVNEHEAILAMDQSTFEDGSLEVVPWKPGEIGDTVIPVRQG